jgi:arylsulfatase
MDTPFDQDRWQLFNVKDDPTELTDLAQKYPKKLQEMKDLWQKEAESMATFPWKRHSSAEALPTRF